MPNVHEQGGLVLMDVQTLSASFVFTLKETIKMNQRKTIELSAVQVNELTHFRKMAHSMLSFPLVLKWVLINNLLC